MVSRKEAIMDAIRYCDGWMGGAAVVTDGQGWYDAIPGAYLSDISYSGPREVVLEVTDVDELAGGHVDIENEEEVAEIAEMFEQNLEV